MILNSILITWTLLLSGIPPFSFLYPQLILAILSYFRQNNISIWLLTPLILIMGDIVVNQNPAAGLVSFAIPGIFILLVSKLTAIGKQHPFLEAKVIWVTLSVLVVRLIYSGFYPSIGDLISALANAFTILLLTKFVKNTRGKSEEIIVE